MILHKKQLLILITSTLVTSNVITAPTIKIQNNTGKQLKPLFLNGNQMVAPADQPFSAPDIDAGKTVEIDVATLKEQNLPATKITKLLVKFGRTPMQNIQLPASSYTLAELSKDNVTLEIEKDFTARLREDKAELPTTTPSTSASLADRVTALERAVEKLKEYVDVPAPTRPLYINTDSSDANTDW